MNNHKYPLGSLLIAKGSKALGYIQDHTRNYRGEIHYSIYWFKDMYVSTSVSEYQVEHCIKFFKEKYDPT